MVGLQLLQAFVDRCHETRPPVIGDPYLGGDKDLVAWDARRADDVSDIEFVLVHLRCVDMTKSLLEGSDQHSLKPRSGHAIRPKSENRNLRAADRQNCAGCVVT